MGSVKIVLFLMLYTFLCQLAFSSSLPHLCPKHQALALLQFEHMFTINPNASSGSCYEDTTLSWNKSTDCCSWNGVHCDETTGQVIELDLFCKGLQGKFHTNSSLFQLSGLKRLDLSYNDFSGSLISAKFGELSSLTHLNVLYSSFTGVIPAEISHLSKLQVLGISTDKSYRLRLEPYNFELLLKNLTQLRVLHLDSVNISSTIPLNFSSYLTTLRLQDIQLCGVLPESVFHLSNLEYLSLSDNPQLTVRFPMSIWNSSASLVKLYLSGVNFTGRIPESFSHLTSLTYLDLSSANLSGPIPKPLWNLTNIELLYLDNNNFDGQLEGLSFNRSWTQLESLDISFNSLTGPIPSNVSGLQDLQLLILSSNYLNGTIPSWIFSLPSLMHLDLSNNSFSGKIHEFKSNNKVYFVSVKQNQLQGPIPKSLLDLQYLQFLILSQNNFSGQIPSTVCNLKTLGLLNLGSNNLEGTIPQCLGQMSRVSRLDLSNNCLSWTINTTFSIGNQFKIIKLHGNKLQGKVPPSLINCRNLEFLDLGNNELNDTFPIWLGGLPDLKILSLRSNKLHGFITDYYSINYANTLIVTTKGLDLELPRVLTTEIIINLSGNRFEGHIPSIIGDLVGLRTLNLSHNGLEGHIPASFHQLSVLESLDLSSNKIGGEIPQQLASLTFLAVLNLSHNHLVGCIPKGKQFDTFENSSYQGNDGLRGFPLSKDCGGDDGVPLDDEEEKEEEEGDLISWQAVLMGFGCGLVIGLSIIYIMLSTHYPIWFSRMVVKFEHRIATRMKRY
ncbi:hypothetical protein T459_21194 [Capsicum annuum]|uniref:Uncharacterized protein n=1 Tax=Capsicum annuum TaxID=4072 RepID=A0A2G2YVX9_CAPAN|nr:hypothetical protein T459_21194 [Capsicum annuum]